jgi:hypothetical protein
MAVRNGMLARLRLGDERDALGFRLVSEMHLKPVGMWWRSTTSGAPG